MRALNLIIVEDEAIIALDLKLTMKRLGMQVLTVCQEADDAVRQAKELHPDMILMDIVLEGEKNGIEAAYEIREFSDVPIVFLTGNTDLLDSQTIGDIKPLEIGSKPPSDYLLHKWVKKVANNF
jgi:DNA-binding NarL/FixJ family response regulator